MPVAVGFRHHVYLPPGVAAPLTGAFSFEVKRDGAREVGGIIVARAARPSLSTKKYPPEPV